MFIIFLERVKIEKNHPYTLIFEGHTTGSIVTKEGWKNMTLQEADAKLAVINEEIDTLFKERENVLKEWRL